MGGCDVPIADSGDCHHHKPVGVEERETTVNTHEVVQQANPGRMGGERKGVRVRETCLSQSAADINGPYKLMLSIQSNGGTFLHTN